MTPTTAAVATPTLDIQTLPAAATWAVDAAHSHVEFAVRHLMISTVRGRFGGVAGTVTLPNDLGRGADAANLPAASVDVAIDVSTIDTRESQRDAHLRSADFFDADHFPTITFRSRSVDELTSARFRVHGDLTIRGVSRPVVLDVTSEGRTTDPWGNERLGFSATGAIKRSDFGLTWNQLLEAGGVAVGDEVKIAIDAELVKATPKQG
jgi:polyisoprenoid-binding protein YceI